MLQVVNSVVNVGLETKLVKVQVDIASRGFPGFDIVGLGDKAVQESKHRIKTAIVNSGFEFPAEKRITVNLAPADINKEGAVYDVPISIAILSMVYGIELPQNSLYIGELSLGGRASLEKRAILYALFAKDNKFNHLFIPQTTQEELKKLDNNITTYYKNLKSLVNTVKTKDFTQNTKSNKKLEKKENYKAQYYPYILGHKIAKRALQICITGRHNMLMCGPPGSGKTMLAKSSLDLDPYINNHETIDVLKVYSFLGKSHEIIRQNFLRPLRLPHHTTSYVGLVGGGSNPLPGEISLAHMGILVLDEITEFPSNTLEALREPLEEGKIMISRSKGNFTFPANFILIGTYNPCKCGYLDHPSISCSCTQYQIQKSKSKLSGPFLDRIDLFINVYPVETNKLSDNTMYKSNLDEYNLIVDNIRKTKKIQTYRFKNEKINYNSQMNTQQIKKYTQLTDNARITLDKAVNTYALSTRAYFKIIKVALTINDLNKAQYIKDIKQKTNNDNTKIDITKENILEALQYRKTD